MSCETCASCNDDVTNDDRVEVCRKCWDQILELVALVNTGYDGAYDSIPVYQLYDLIPESMETP